MNRDSRMDIPKWYIMQRLKGLTGISIGDDSYKKFIVGFKAKPRPNEKNC